MGRINEAQLELLRYLCRQSGPALRDHLDGRVVRALKNRGLIQVRGDWVSPTPDGRAAHAQAAALPNRRRSRRRVTAGSARAEAILKATDALERALPIDSEVDLAHFRAYADDIVTGLRQFARQMDRSRGL